MEEVELTNIDGNKPTNDNNNTNNNNNDDHPDVEASTSAFDAMAKDLEGQSEQMRLQEEKRRDIENGGESWETEEDFKLRSYFENSQRMHENIGGKPKRMGISIRDLTVVGRGADVSVIADMLTPFVWFGSFFTPSGWSKKSNQVNGFCKDGEMLLVLGRPGAGCSTLLRVISNQRKSYIDVEGKVTYGGIPAEKMARYRGEAIYTPEEDTHHPTLTVRETLDFTLKCKTPSEKMRLPDETKRNFRTKMFDLLLKMFGIVHQADTIVGNEWIRGLSGGERKRMTITEAMVSSASVTAWDCSTRGLDAASALDYAKSLRIMSDTLKKTTVASFYQASDSIYNLFDRVMILEKGRCIFFGPIDQAKQYFLDLGFDCEPRKSVPDFLTGVTNPQERKIRPGFEGKIPETSADFEAAWHASPLYQAACNEQAEYEQQVATEKPDIEFRQQVKAEKSKTTRKGGPYTTSFITQVMALTIRHFQIIWGDKFSIVSRYFSVIAQAFIYGSVFYQQGMDAAGIFTRGGCIFSTMLFNAFLSQGELPMTFMGRRILQKQRAYAMYRPAAFHVAQVVTDLPIIFLQVFLFSIIAYFMFGLEYDAGKFFVFCFILIGLSLACTNLFRAFGNFCPSMYVSQNILVVFLIMMVTYAGYTVPYDKMHPWFQWFFWINPFSYAFKALMANEFKHQIYECSKSAIPYGPHYEQNYPNNRICGISGSVQGEYEVTGETYLKSALHFKTSDMALNTVVVYLWWLLFTALNMIAMEKFDWTAGGYTHKVYKKGKAPKMNDVQAEKEMNQLVQQATENMKDTLILHGGVFTWQDIKYTVPVPEGTRLLLDNVEGWIKPGQMTALMGASGAGKTTLLDVLAKRKTIGTIEGHSYLNGRPLEIDFERITGYVEQMDVHNPALTVRESLQFSARLRQEPSISLEEKYAYVERVLEMMEMKHLGDALIGDLESGVGISVEERKRLTIGVELVAKPHILFLDEPTSGLDAQSSYNIIKFIRKLADSGMPLVCTIHQPSSVLFEHFDRLLLLAKGGKTVYFGDIGARSKTLTAYFERNGVRPCTENENPAEYILEGIGAGVHGKSDVDWPAAWKSSPECAAVHAELASLEKTHVASTDDGEKAREFATGSMYQTWEVYKRMNLIWWRDPYYSFGRFVQAGLVGLIIGFTYYDLQDSSSDMLSRVFIIFQALILGIMLIFNALPQFFIQREYFRRDYASKFYSWFPFALSIVLVEIPYLLVTGTIFFVALYWTAGLEYNSDTGFYFWFMFMMYLFFCVSFGQALAAVCINMFFAMIIVPLLIIFFFLFCGVMTPPKDLPTFWRSWMYPLNPCRYFLEGIVTNVLRYVQVKCTDEDLFKFDPPAGMTCGNYTSEFNTYKLSGYIDNPDATSQCGYCTYNNGPEYYENLDWSFDNRWRNFGILTCYWVFNTALVILFVYLTRKATR
ncbi:ABC transporter G family protein [Heterostelium album PN500]|uniref:ABC transporter G family protein n=1 Tax=Heterostelium pallidum (strain ATCC 26659 / Pp 5 / PN500) TaxID=670386 RepID=D3BFY1_HETP5|nr:ABC transporter G family protein [Heterostelium album PN500]EFA79741.1 ABC transporter G family protein [Heterostelium album PN500]|eukprot:XP_020431862.1 ABC transporter G family protein [Heterostelium album PN500]